MASRLRAADSSAGDEEEGDGGDPLAKMSPEFRAMMEAAGGLAGHTQRLAELIDKRAAKSKEAGKQKDDEVYLESYAELAIHEDMLKDQPRVEAYRRAIEHYGAAWRQRGDVSVVDVGSGTGLLAVLCARAGARRVLAVEASRIAHFLRSVAEKNAPAGTIEVRECRAEDLALGEGEAVDVIVSEWMGYFLLFENMLPSVLSVRRFLKPDGIMLPSRCRLQLAPLEDGAWRAAKLDFWRDVHGIDMTALVPLAVATACEKPQHRLVPVDGLLGAATTILSIDLLTVQDADLQRFEAALSFEVPAGRRLDGFATWFECEFGEAGWLLSTSPSEPPSHWRQTAFCLRQPIEGGGGLSISGSVVVDRHEDYSRGYRVTFDLEAPGRKKRSETFELR